MEFGRLVLRITDSNLRCKLQSAITWSGFSTPVAYPLQPCDGWSPGARRDESLDPEAQGVLKSHPNSNLHRPQVRLLNLDWDAIQLVLVAGTEIVYPSYKHIKL